MKTASPGEELSAFIVSTLLAHLGPDETARILAVFIGRLQGMAEGHGRLSTRQYERITELSGRSWQRWVLESTPMSSISAEMLAFHVDTVAMLERFEASDDSTRASRTEGRKSSQVAKLSPRKSARARRAG